MVASLKTEERCDETCSQWLVLGVGEDLRSQHFRFPSGSTTNFTCGSSLSYFPLDFYTNYVDESSKFCRTRFTKVPFNKEYTDAHYSTCGPERQVYVTLTLALPGAYSFYVIHEHEEPLSSADVASLFAGERKFERVMCFGNFVVDPLLRSDSGGKHSLDSLSIQTVVSRCMGPLNEWEGRLEVASKSGYNSIHFTPFQKYGSSGSCYSISNHEYFDPSVFDGKICEHLPRVINKAKEKFKCMIVDVVLNHMSNDSDVAFEHPESFYNLENSPHLRPAFLVDRALFYFSRDLCNNNSNGARKCYQVKSQGDVGKIASILREQVIPSLRLIEFFVVDIVNVVGNALEYAKRSGLGLSQKQLSTPTSASVTIIQDPQYRRLGSTICFKTAFDLFFRDAMLDGSPGALDASCQRLREHLTRLNMEQYSRVSELVNNIIRGVCGHVYYEFVDPKGPCRQSVSGRSPLATNYFSVCIKNYTASCVEEDEKLMNSEGARRILASQGWVFGCSTCDFAAPDSQIYLSRQLVAWGDSVKIRYGNSKSDSPFIWNYMGKYVESMARIFDGFRLDNCHSTPVHVLEHFVDASRRVNKNLVLVAELFTGSEHQDNLFVNRIGLTCLIRERMSAHNLQELCRLVHRFGGAPVGSFIPCGECFTVKPEMARAAIIDMTHDNETICNRFSPLEHIPSTAFVSMAVCPVGSVRGTDEVVPQQVDVVSEKRRYTSWEDSVDETDCFIADPDTAVSDNSKGKVSYNSGLIVVREFLNNFHNKIAEENFSHIYVDQLSDSVVTVTRSNPDTCESYILISNHALCHVPSDRITKIEKGEKSTPFPLPTDSHYPDLVVPGVVNKVMVEAFMCSLHDDSAASSISHQKYITGITKYVSCLRRNINVGESRMLSVKVISEYGCSGRTTSVVSLTHFPPGSIAIVRSSLHEDSAEALRKIRLETDLLMKDSLAFITHTDACSSEVAKALVGLTSSDINFILFKSRDEEQAKDPGSAEYNVPGYGSFNYMGLAGVNSVMSEIRMNNDLGHPLCKNLRDGHWLLDHITNRLERNPKTVKVADSLGKIFSDLKKLPSFLLPAYFDLVVRSVFDLVVNFQFSKLAKGALVKDHFCKRLVASTFALVGVVGADHSPPPLHQSVAAELPPYIDQGSTVSAGLPHFAVSWARTWGRDIFISLKGLLLHSGRHFEAKMIILSVASCLRHGLIPNLVSNQGVSPRFNARDAVWFFLRSVQNYCNHVNDSDILTSKVYRTFQTDDAEPLLASESSVTTLEELIQEIMQKHFDGISFKERHSGPRIDSVMKEPGFHVECGVDKTTGFVYGGNKHNCGTWMDKMGSSSSANNLGVPATPRDGSAVELVALCASCCLWLHNLHADGRYPYSGVKCVNAGAGPLVVSWIEWYDRVRTNFEKAFWVPKNREKAATKFGDEANLVHKVGIYKDSVGASSKFCDYQLRPNFLVALCVAPELFTPKRAILALDNVRTKLLGPYGVATLDPDDLNYCGYYHSGDQTWDYKVAQGFNYHQGPEWVWLTGFYVMAQIKFLQYRPVDQRAETVGSICMVLGRLSSLEKSNPWLGLPELTQRNGEFCQDSCRIQAWSVGTVIESLFELFNQGPLHSRSPAPAD